MDGMRLRGEVSGDERMRAHSQVLQYVRFNPWYYWVPRYVRLIYTDPTFGWRNCTVSAPITSTVSALSEIIPDCRRNHAPWRRAESPHMANCTVSAPHY